MHLTYLDKITSHKLINLGLEEQFMLQPGLFQNFPLQLAQYSKGSNFAVD